MGICRDLPELSEQIISTRLADLREIGMIDRYVRQDSPIAVDYSPTDAGQQLAAAASTIREFSLNNSVHAA
ncbi:MAG: helix-turn-helix transcriptional regulator [Solirubrobacterales bacterium]|nr:helix-turn-helix transcriptional regulator [Solirubrobacterales bacterium]